MDSLGVFPWDLKVIASGVRYKGAIAGHKIMKHIVNIDISCFYKCRIFE